MMKIIRLETSMLRDGIPLACALGLLVVLLGCGNYSGETAEEPETTTLAPIPGMSLSEQVEAYEATVYPLLVRYCGDGCHDTGAEDVPFLFANSNVTNAYQVIRGARKVDWENPPQSRIVRQPAGNLHNCGSRCAEIGAEILAQVEAWAAIIDASSGGTEGEVEVDAIASDEVAFSSGVEIENGERYEGNLIAFYGFTEGAGSLAFDTSGVSPAINLQIANAEWMGSHGLVMDGSRLIADRDSSRKLFDEIADPGDGTGQYTVEMWVNNANVTQENARIVSYVRNGGDRNFSVHQQEYQYAVRNRSTAEGSGLDGRQELITDPDDQDAQETLQHVVVTYNRLFGRRVYVDARFTGDDDPIRGGRLWNWNPDAQLVVGSNRSGNDNFWRGQIRMLAIYKQALSDSQIRKNFLAGVGKRVILTFDVGGWTGTDAKLQFSATELDSYSYILCQPTFVGTDLDGIRVKNIRITVNPGDGIEPPAEGQSFINVDQRLSGSQDQVSRQCTIVPKGTGPLTDTFRVEFEELGLFADPVTSTQLVYEPSNATIPRPPEIGFRDFARIHATMAALTGVDPMADRAVDPGSTETIQDIYEDLQQQLPSTHDVRSIVSSHQVGVTKLAFEFCLEAVDRPDLREAIFGAEFEAGTPSFFASDVATAFGNAALSDLLTERLVDHMMGAWQLIEQPLRAELVSDLDSLRDDLVTTCQAPCGAEETRSIAKGMCTAILSSAPIMVH